MRLGRREFLAAAGGAALGQSRQPRLFFNCDMDGSPGIFTREQAWYWENGARPEVGQAACRLFTADINAQSQAALAAGAAGIIVCDTHHGGVNFVQDQLLRDPRIQYLYRSVGMEGAQRRWMPGLNETISGLLLPGHHAKTGTEGAFLPHTWNFEWLDFTINGQSVGEIGIEACYAGHWDIPLIHVQGDEAACAEAKRQFPWIVTTAVKRGTTDACTGLTPDAAMRETARGIQQAIEGLRAGRMRPYKPALPMTITLRMRTMDAAARAAQRPGVLRLDDHTLEARVGRQCDVVKWLLGTGLDMPPEPPRKQ